MDDKGNFKGDALILFFRPESVDLAVQLLDETEFRLGQGQKMKVAAADFSYKTQKDAPAKSNLKEKKKIIKKTQKLNRYVHNTAEILSVGFEADCEQQARRLGRRRSPGTSRYEFTVG